MSDLIRVIKIPLGLQRMAARLRLRFDDDLILKALRQYLSHIAKTRDYKQRMRTQPATKERWYEKRRAHGRQYREEIKERLRKAKGKP
jgi:hypothetical protein